MPSRSRAPATCSGAAPFDVRSRRSRAWCSSRSVSGWRWFRGDELAAHHAVALSACGHPHEIAEARREHFGPAARSFDEAEPDPLVRLWKLFEARPGTCLRPQRAADVTRDNERLATQCETEGRSAGRGHAPLSDESTRTSLVHLGDRRPNSPRRETLRARVRTDLLHDAVDPTKAECFVDRVVVRE